MGEKKVIYDIFLFAWGLLKKYGFCRLSVSQWDRMVMEANMVRKEYKGYSKAVFGLYGDILQAVQNYYAAKEKESGDDGQISFGEELKNG